jgi:NAD+ kinase
LVLGRILSWAAPKGVEITSNLDAGGSLEGEAPGRLPDDDSLRESFAGADVAVTLGGDGTLLYAAHVVAPLAIPVLSVHLGSLGFHTQVEPGNIIKCLDVVLAGEFRTEPRLLLQAELDGPGVSGDPTKPRIMLALNDVVVSKSAWGRMVHLRICINGKPASDLFADGLVIATPTGSSAYNYAARGPVLEPSLEAIVVNSICPHRMNFSPLVLGPNTAITVEFHPRKSLEEAQLLVDGQAWCFVSHEEKLKISRAPMYLPLIVFEDTFFQRLREKLAWGGLT